MKQVFYLYSCDTCKRIIKQLQLKEKNYTFQDIKSEKISKAQIEELHKMAGSYEKLFSKTSRQFKARNIADTTLSESDYKKLILEEYTFLKRPVIISDKNIFIGNSKETIAEAQRLIG